MRRPRFKLPCDVDPILVLMLAVVVSIGGVVKPVVQVIPTSIYLNDGLVTSYPPISVMETEGEMPIIMRSISKMETAMLSACYSSIRSCYTLMHALRKSGYG
jgi:hypothetical protein